MLIGDGWAFVHIPKCGGTSVRRALTGIEVGDVLPMGDFATVSHPFHLVTRRRRPEPAFAFIRHPVAWYRSYWAMRTAEKKIEPNKTLDSVWSPDPNEWVANCCRQFPGYVDSMFAAYIAQVDQVFRLEDGIDRALKIMTGERILTKHHNRGRPVPLNRESIEMIKTSESKLIKEYYS